MVFENKSLYLYINIFNNELNSIFTKDMLLKIYLTVLYYTPQSLHIIDVIYSLI